jgi:haloalkane dehalogenase
MYQGPHPAPQSRVPVHVMPREILTAHELLTGAAQRLPKIADKPALIVWAGQDQAFKEPHRLRWEQTFPDHRTAIPRSASHYIQQDAPQEILAAISEWPPGAAGS